MKLSSKRIHLTLLLGLFLPAVLASPAQAGSYRVPRGKLAGLGEAAMPPSPEVEPHGRWLLLLESAALPPVAERTGPEITLADRIFNPRTLSPAGSRTWRGLVLVDLKDGTSRRVQGLPEPARLNDASFSPDGRRIAFSHTGEAGVELWIADAGRASARRLSRLHLHGVWPRPCHWLPDSRGLLCRAAPEPRGDPPSEPAGPRVRDSAASSAPEAPVAEARQLAYYARSQLVRVSVEGRVARLGSPGLFRRAEPSPDGRHLLVERFGTPESLAVSTDRFPLTVEVWDASGRPVRELARLPHVRAMPPGEDAARPGPRAFGWRADAAATLVWTEAQDGGDPARAASVRDRLHTLAAPFTGEPAVLAGLPGRLAEIHWGNGFALAAEEWHGQGGRRRLWRLAPGRTPRVLLDSSLDEAAADPAEPVLAPGPWGARIVAGEKTVYLLRGHAAGAEPRVDEIDLAGGRATTLWRSQPPYLELPAALLGPGFRLLLTRRESATEPPDFFLRDLSQGTLNRLTRLPPPAPDLAPIRSETLTYQRADGVPLTATLSVPASWEPAQGPLPALVWIDPGAGPGAPAALSPYLYPRPSPLAPRLWASEGYAVLEPSLPVLARDGKPSIGYAERLVAGVEAAIAEAERRGAVDRKRLAAGGHSFGASAVATLLAETDLFRAGIALSGAYNRTLTPFGFQWERRTLWNAPETYLEMSPLLGAPRIREPLLLVHGLADPHPSTPPLQSEQMWNALNGLGGTARLVLLPHEGHTYQARESVLHVLAEIQDWLLRYVFR